MTFRANFSTFTDVNNCTVEFDGISPNENLPVSIFHNVVNILSIPVATVANFFSVDHKGETFVAHTSFGVSVCTCALRFCNWCLHSTVDSHKIFWRVDP